MVHALDRETVIEEVLGGAGVVAVTTYAPVSPWADPGLEPWGYDPDEARRLLQMVRDKEKQRREELARRNAGAEQKVDKDW